MEIRPVAPHGAEAPAYASQSFTSRDVRAFGSLRLPRNLLKNWDGIDGVGEVREAGNSSERRFRAGDRSV